jgi:hypothetical protein
LPDHLIGRIADSESAHEGSNPSWATNLRSTMNLTPAQATRARKFGVVGRSPRNRASRVVNLDAISAKLGLTKEQFIAQYITNTAPITKPQD